MARSRASRHRARRHRHRRRRSHHSRSTGAVRRRRRSPVSTARSSSTRTAAVPEVVRIVASRMASVWCARAVGTSPDEHGRPGCLGRSPSTLEGCRRGMVGGAAVDPGRRRSRSDQRGRRWWLDLDRAAPRVGGGTRQQRERFQPRRHPHVERGSGDRLPQARCTWPVQVGARAAAHHRRLTDRGVPDHPADRRQLRTDLRPRDAAGDLPVDQEAEGQARRDALAGHR